MSDPGFSRWLDDASHDTGFDQTLDDESHDTGFVQGADGLLDGLPDADVGSSLHLLMEPRDIASVPGLPQHVYDEAAMHDQLAATGGQPGGYVSHLDQISLAPQGLNPSGLDLSASAKQSADNQSKTGEKYEQGAKAAEYFGKGIEGWNAQNKVLGLHLGPEGSEMLEKYAGPIGKGLVAVDNGLQAAHEIANGAPVLPTIAGAGIKTGSTLGAMALGAAGGAEIGSLGGPVGSTVGGAIGGVAGAFAPDWVYRNMSNQQVGEAAGRVLDDAGRSYDRYVIRNPYYDPRLMSY